LGYDSSRLDYGLRVPGIEIGASFDLLASVLAVDGIDSGGILTV
jgi:hypothetical protein